MPDLYDTSVFIDYWRGDPGAVTLVSLARSAPGTILYRPMSAMELWQYPALGRREEIEYFALTRYFLRESPVSTAVAIKAGQWLRRLDRRARMRLAADALIAATAEEEGATAHSRNSKDIERFYSRVQSY